MKKLLTLAVLGLALGSVHAQMPEPSSPGATQPLAQQATLVLPEQAITLPPVKAEKVAQKPASSETPAPQVSGAPAPAVVLECAAHDPGACYGPAAQQKFWGGAEYLLWWVKDQPLPDAVVTVNDTGAAPVLGTPGTRVVYGGDQSLGSFNGVRATVGAWLDEDANLGLEVSGFYLPRRSSTFSFASDAAGNPSSGFVGVDAATGLPIISPISGPGLATGDATLTAATRLWGLEANGLYNLYRGQYLGVSLLAGFRYLRLDESLDVLTSSSLLFAPVSFDSTDRFRTRDQFYGGQVGLRGRLQQGIFSLDLTGKVALGVNHQVIDISGTNTLRVAGAAPVVQNFGAVYALPGAIGRRTNSEFGVVPEVQVKLGVALTDYLRLTVGYDFLYWNQVVRPGDQINQTINLAGPTPTTTPLLNRSDFWAHGVSFGVELRY